MSATNPNCVMLHNGLVSALGLGKFKGIGGPTLGFSKHQGENLSIARETTGLTQKHEPVPLEVGDNVVVIDDNEAFPGIVKSMSPWSFILVETESGHLYLDVVLNISAAYFSRLVRLEQWVNVEDTIQIVEIADQTSFRPKRTNVDDVDGALRLCSPNSDIRRAPS